MGEGHQDRQRPRRIAARGYARCHRSPQRFRTALASERPQQIAGAINANHALLAKAAGFRAIHLSRGGVAVGSLAQSSRTPLACGIHTVAPVPLTLYRRAANVDLGGCLDNAFCNSC